MPRTVSFPAPSAVVCPVCSADLASPRCDRCRAVFSGSDGRTLWRVDHDLHDLSLVRNDLVERLLADAAMPVGAVPVVAGRQPVDLTRPAVRPGFTGVDAGVPPAASPHVGSPHVGSPHVGSPHVGSPSVGPPPVRSAEPGRSGPTVAELLVGAGALSLVAAVVVFAAVKWSDLAAWAQGGLIVALTGAVLATAIGCRIRGLVATSEALASVTVALGLADVHVARVAFDGVASSGSVWAVGLGALAASGVALGARTGIRTFTLAGAVVAFAPAVVGLGVDRPTVLAAALAGQALLAAVAAAAWRDRLGRAVVEVGLWCSWGAAAFVALGTAIDGWLQSTPVPAVGPALVLAGLGLGSPAVAVGAGGRLRGSAVLAGAGTALLFVPAPLVLATTGWVGALTVPVVLGIQASVAAGVASVARAVRGPVRSAVVAGGVASWLGAVAGALGVGLAEVIGDGGSAPGPSVAVLVAVAAVAVVGARFGGWRRDGSAVALSAAVTVGVAAAGLGVSHLDGGPWSTVVLAVAAALTLASALLDRFDRFAWGPARATGSVLTAGLGLVPLAALVAAATGLLEAATGSPAVGADVGLTAWLGETVRPEVLPSWATVAQLAMLAVVVGSGYLAGRRWWRWAAVAVAVATVTALPFVLDLTAGATVAGLLVMAVAGAARLVQRPDEPETVVATGALAVLAVAVSMASVPLAVATTSIVAALLVGLAVLSVEREAASAPAWVAASAGSVIAATAIDAWIAEAPGSTGAVAVAVVATAVGATAGLLERRAGPKAASAALVIDLVSATALGLAALAADSIDGLSAVTAVAVVAAGAAAVRPSRRSMWVVAAGLGVGLLWLRMIGAEVEVVEAYTVPLAAWLLAIGLVVGEGRGSWARYGAGLTALMAPTAVLALGDADPGRTVAAVALGVGMAVWGGAERLQAPLAVGLAVVGLIAVRHLGPVAAELPRYLVFAVAGLVLLALGATFEERRRDLRQAREVFARLR